MKTNLKLIAFTMILVVGCADGGPSGRESGPVASSVLTLALSGDLCVGTRSQLGFALAASTRYRFNIAQGEYPTPPYVAPQNGQLPEDDYVAVDVPAKLLLDGKMIKASSATAGLVKDEGDEAVFGLEGGAQDLLVLREKFPLPDQQSLVLELRASVEPDSDIVVSTLGEKGVLRTLMAQILTSEGQLTDSLPVEDCKLDSAESTIRTEFDAGEVELVLQNYLGYRGEERRLVRARGSIDGTVFEQRDFTALLYDFYDYSQITGSFLILFDDRIGGDCGVAIENVGGNSFDLVPAAYSVDCAMRKRREFVVSDVSEQ